MWAIIYPVCTLPLLIMLFIAQHRAHRAGTLKDYKSPFAQYGAMGLVRELFWQLDVIGIILMIAVFALILVPLTLAGGVASNAQTWKQAHIRKLRWLRTKNGKKRIGTDGFPYASQSHRSS
jgi:SIT family siderophore-iron:H+ symporter-like MFS transporter